jgi:penicillin-binding protein 2
MTEFQIRLRSYAFRGVTLFVFAILAGQLWNLQVLQGDYYRQQADANRFRVAPSTASRGVIYDRNGKLLARNQPIYDVVIIPAYLPDDATAEATIFARLSELLNMPITTQTEPVVGRYNSGYFHAITHHVYNRQSSRQIINPRSRQYRNAPLGIRDAVNRERFTAPYRPVAIAEDVNPLIIARIEEERLALPGVLIDISPTRSYPYGPITSHILGYTGPVPAEEYELYRGQGYNPFDPTNIVGLTGLEALYEEDLRGIKGLETVEVDVTGQKIRAVSQEIRARPGHNLKLTIDIGLQEATAAALQEALDEVEARQGVAIAMNPQTGEILAMVSLPSFDNNDFSGGISLRDLSVLSEDPATPLVNHAIAGLYPPGSTFKVIPAAGALQEGTVRYDTVFVDEGVLKLPNEFEPENERLAQPFFCWEREGHGEVTMLTALGFSCDVYFYQIGGGYWPSEYEGLGLERLIRYAEMFGMGAPTGIDLPGEAAGLVPNRKWKRINYSESWVTGDTYNMSIGQGFVLATPLQVLNMAAATANGGTLYRPYIVQEILDADDNLLKETKPEVIRHLEVDRQHLRLIQFALQGVIEWGTARKTFDLPGIVASGKTGTAEYCDSYPQCIDSRGRVKTSHAWFFAYAPSDAPEIVTVVFVYGGGEGSVVAVPVTNKMLRYYFGIPEEEEEEEAADEAELFYPLQNKAVTVRLLGTDIWPQSGANISGFVLDEQGQGLGDVTVQVLAEDAVLAQVISSPTGQFDYNIADASLVRDWQVRLADYPAAPALSLEIVNGLRYLVEFKAQ